MAACQNPSAITLITYLPMRRGYAAYIYIYIYIYIRKSHLKYHLCAKGMRRPCRHLCSPPPGLPKPTKTKKKQLKNNKKEPAQVNGYAPRVCGGASPPWLPNGPCPQTNTYAAAMRRHVARPMWGPL